MRFARWIDHLPPWLAWGAVASTGIYEPFSLLFMALPLLAAALVEWRHWGLGRWRRGFESLALVVLVALVLARIGLIPVVVHILFLLCGIRLALPRELAHRRQILLMGFTLWITTAISTLDISFLFWSLAWIPGTALVLLQQSWEGSASLRRGPLVAPPYPRVLRWTFASLCIAAGFFVTLPRLGLGLRAFPWGVSGLTASRAGLSDLVDLGGSSPIQPSGEVVLRIIPPADLSQSELDRRASALALLRGLVLENADGLRWKPGAETRPLPRRSVDDLRFRPSVLDFDYFVAPSPLGVLALPYGTLALEPPPGMPLRPGAGGSLRWSYPSRRPMTLRVFLDPAASLSDTAPQGQRLALLTSTGDDLDCAEHWSRRAVPEELPPRLLAHRLSALLQRFRYTLDNPSGSAANPMEDFLERSRAGHCEYFASALTAMLRRRGVPARVVNGYRLGPWIAEGGYWLVTQDEAHSWVEYFDQASSRWWVADPTPAAPPSGITRMTLAALMRRWMDNLSYQWDRHVVRFSDEDQVAGLEWFQTRASTLSSWRMKSRPPILGSALVLAVLVALAWLGWRAARTRRRSPLGGGIPALRPLLRKTWKLAPPGDGETARAWLLRLARLRPDRLEALLALTDQVDAEAYGERPKGAAAKLAKAEARRFSRSGRPDPR